MRCGGGEFGGAGMSLQVRKKLIVDCGHGYLNKSCFFSLFNWVLNARKSLHNAWVRPEIQVLDYLLVDAHHDFEW